MLKMNDNNIIYIEKNDLLDAYKNGNADNKEMLEHLFGKELFKPENVMRRVKTFEDAMAKLDNNHPLVCEYRAFCTQSDDISSDMMAYLKLRIITAALNEGWKPQFTNGEYRYFPWYWLYTKEKIAKMSEEDRKKVVLFGGSAAHGAYAGFAFAYSHHDPSSASATVGSRLCFKSDELAEYAGNQFKDIYFNFLGNR